MTKKFKIQDLNGNPAMGNYELPEENVYISAYGAYVDGYKPVGELEVDEMTRKVYALSGQKPTMYIILRTA